MTCRLITSPVSGEQIQSNFYNSLRNRFGEDKANDLFDTSLSKEYTFKYGSWLNNTSVLNIDSNGEPILDDSFLTTVVDFKQPRQELEEKLISFIKGMGFSYERVNEILTPNNISVSGVTDFLIQSIKVAEGSDLSTLSEEAGHVYVEWLEQKQSPLFNSLMSDITKFEIFKKVEKEYGEIYNYDIDKLKKEAIGKAIGEYLIKKTEQGESSENLNRLSRWFNRVREFLKGVFGISSKTLEDYLTVDDILNTKEKLQKRNYVLYDISPKLQSIFDKIINIDSKLTKQEIDGKEKYVYEGKVVKNRVSDILEKQAEKIFGKQDETFKVTYEHNRQTGSLGHKDIENVITRYLEKRDGATNLTPKTNNLKDDATYLKLEKVIHDILNKPEFKNAKIFTEVKILNANKDLAGTIDLLIIDSDGTAHIYDWKFVENDKEITPYKRKTWTTQLNSYKETLETYGIKKFGQMRMLPLTVKYDENNKFEKLTFDNNTILDEVKPSRSERFTDKKYENLNLLLSKLYSQLNKIDTIKGGTQADIDKRKSILYDINKAIDEILVHKSIGETVKYLYRQLDLFYSKLNSEDLTEKDLIDIYEFSDYFSSLNASGIFKYDVDERGVQQNNISAINSKIQQLESLANDKLQDFIANDKIDINNLSFNSYSDRFVQLGQIQNPIFRLLNQLKNEANDNIDKEYKSYRESLQEILEQLKKEENSGNLFDRILQKDSKGNYTGKLINQFSKSLFTFISNATTSQLENEIILKDKDKFDEELEQLANYYGERYKNEPDKATKFITNWRYKNDFWDSKYKKSALENLKKKKYHRFVEFKDKWLSDEYKYIVNNKDKAISKLYYNIQETIKEARKYNPNVSKNFIPNVKKTLVQQLLSNGGIGAIKENMIDSLIAEPYEQNVDENGQPISNIPLKYVTNVKGEKSLELGEVFALFHHSVLQNKYLSEIEGKSNLLKYYLKNGTYYARKWNGDKIKEADGVTDKTFKINESNDGKETIQQLQEFINYHIYQIKTETKDFEIGGVSGIKLISGLQSYFSTLNIGFNPFTAFSNVTGGTAMSYSFAHKGKYYGKGNLAKANSLIGSRNKTALALTEFFDIATTNNTFEKAKSLSTDIVDKLFTMDKFFVLMKSGEWFVQNSNLIAYLDNHTIENGVVVKKTEQSQKSLMELTVEKDGKISIEGLSEQDFNLIRKRVRGINTEVLGSLPERDIILAQKHLGWRVILQFKNWILPMAKARFGDLSYNDNLEDFEEGRMRMVFRTFVKDGLSPKLFKTVADLTMATFTKPNQSLDSKIEELYNEHLNRHPEFSEKISLSEYKELYLQNIKSLQLDLILIGSFLLLIAAIKPDDDDEEVSGVRKFFSVGMQKALTELTFWFNINSAIKLAGSQPIPLIGLYKRFQDVAVSGFNLLDGADEKELDKSTTNLSKIIIGWNNYNVFMKNLEKLEDDNFKQ